MSTTKWRTTFKNGDVLTAGERAGIWPHIDQDTIQKFEILNAAGDVMYTTTNTPIARKYRHAGSPDFRGGHYVQAGADGTLEVVMIHNDGRGETATTHSTRPGHWPHSDAGLDEWRDTNPPRNGLSEPTRKTPAKLSAKTNAPFVPTKAGALAAMLELAELHPMDHVVELGAGDARISIAAAAQHGCTVTAVESDPDRAREAIANIARTSFFFGGSILLRTGNIYDEDLRHVDVVLCYLNNPTMDKLVEQFGGLPDRARIISNTYRISNATTTAAQHVDNPTAPPNDIYRYDLPLRLQTR